MPLPQDRCAPPADSTTDESTLVPAPLPRRGFLGLALGASAVWLSGCGDDGGAAGTEGQTGTDTGTGDAGTSTGAQSLDSTGLDDASTGALDDSSGGTGEPTECVDEAFVETFDAEAIAQDDAVFPYAIMAGEMRTTSALLAVQVPAMPAPEAIWLRVWRPGADEDTVAVVVEAEVELDADGYAKIPVEGLCPGTWYRYAYFVGSPARATARSQIAELRTAPEDDVLEPLSLAITACNGSSLDWPALLRTADEYYDAFIHLGDMVYADGSFSREEYRQVWREYLAAEGYRTALSRSGMYATWDDHEIDDNSNFDRETMSADQLLKRQNAMDAFFETLPIEAEGPDYQLWRTFRWGLTAEIIVLDCRYERRPSIDQYISPAQMDFLQQRLLDSPCHFKIIVNSVPITNMPTLWDIAAGDRWEGYPAQRNELLSFIDDNLITNVWFLSGDFHTCFVSRIEPSGGLTSNTYEIAVTGGNSNPLPDFATGFDSPQFDYGTTDPRGCLLLFDPESNAVNIRFLDPQTGEALFDETISQAGG